MLYESAINCVNIIENNKHALTLHQFYSFPTTRYLGWYGFPFLEKLWFFISCIKQLNDTAFVLKADIYVKTQDQIEESY